MAPILPKYLANMIEISNFLLKNRIFQETNFEKKKKKRKPNPQASLQNIKTQGNSSLEKITYLPFKCILTGQNRCFFFLRGEKYIGLLTNLCKHSLAQLLYMAFEKN